MNARFPSTAVRLATAVTAASVLVSGCMMNTSNRRESSQEPTDEQRFELYSTTATYLYQDNSFLKAQDQAVKALNIDPDNFEMRRMVGWIKLRLGSARDLTIAEEFFRELLRDGDDNSATYVGLGATLERLGVGYNAQAQRVRNGELPPRPDQTIEVTAGRLEDRAVKSWEEAVRLFESTTKDGEGSTDALNGLQRTNALLGRYDESLAWSARLIEQSQAEVETWDRMLTRSNVNEKEETLFSENRRVAVQLQVDTHLFATTILNRLGRLDEAIAHLDAVIEVAPDVPQAYSRRAQLLAKAGRYEQAIADLDRFLGLSDSPFEDPEIARAFDLQAECRTALEKAN